ncbi:L-gulono-1,4-lactone dehydrogenase [soil metagenome]
MARWTNWSKEQSCRPISIERPGSVAQLQRFVAGATSSGRTVRASGTGHSFTDIALTDGVMVRLDRLTSVIGYDHERGRFKVEGGIVLGELNRALDRHGVAFANLGDIDRQTVSGSVSTGTHGTGVGYPSVSAQIAELELVVADGSLLTIDESSPELLRAARVGLGALGVVYSVTIDVVPAFTIDRTDRSRPLAKTLERLDELVAANDHFEFYVFPYTETALCRESRRSTADPAPRNRALAYAQDVMLENWVAQLFVLTARRTPSQTERFSKLAAAGVGQARTIDRSFEVFASERHVRFTEMEYAIPREQARDALRRVLAIASKHEHHVAFPIEVRFASGDDSFLSTSYGRDTAYIAVHQDPKLDWQPYFAEVEAVMREYEGRPHWGKRHTRTAEEFAALYPEWEAFAKARDELDPRRSFRNAYTDRVLG